MGCASSKQADGNFKQEHLSPPAAADLVQTSPPPRLIESTDQQRDQAYNVQLRTEAPVDTLVPVESANELNDCDESATRNDNHIVVHEAAVNIAIENLFEDISDSILDGSDEGDQKAIALINPEVAKMKDPVPDRDQQTLLTIVAIYGRRALVRPLVDMGADCNARDADGYPIYWACCMGHSDVALELAALGADPTVNVSGITALDLAKSKLGDAVAREIEETYEATLGGEELRRRQKIKDEVRAAQEAQEESVKAMMRAQGQSKVRTHQQGAGGASPTKTPSNVVNCWCFVPMTG